jgi:hypothetical protein
MPLVLLGWQGGAVPATANKAADTPAESAAATPEKAGMIGPQHRQLAALVGEWQVTQSFWTTGNPDPKIDTGHASYATVLGGRHLRQDLNIDSAGKVFEALGYIGYDNAEGRYYSSWMDVNFTGVIMAYGDYDAARHTYTFTGTLPGPASGDAAIPLRAELQVKDANHLTYDFYERHGDKETLAVRLEYARQNQARQNHAR